MKTRTHLLYHPGPYPSLWTDARGLRHPVRLPGGCSRSHHLTLSRIHSFLIDKSIDDKMIALQERKTKIINGALGNGNKDKSKKQLAEDLALIFAD